MKTNKYLVKYANAQIGKPYWFGCFGQKASLGLLNEKRRMYPGYYTASDFPVQARHGKKCHDCIGLIKGALWCDTPTGKPKYNPEQDVNAAGMYRISKNKGKISSMPKVDGILVYKGTSPAKIHHVGIYNDGYVTEAKGHAWGVVREKFNDSWNYWSECPFIEYEEEDEPEKPKNRIKKAAYFDEDMAGRYKTVSGLNLRIGPGVGFEVIHVLHTKEIVTCKGYYSKVDGKKWLVVKTKDGVVGFCNMGYLRRC